VNIGERYTLAWKNPHRVECEVLELTPDSVIVEAVHRCSVTCYLVQMRQTLPIEGRLSFRYQDFAKLFVRVNPGAIALPA
jgi:hypothetical protein